MKLADGASLAGGGGGGAVLPVPSWNTNMADVSKDSPLPPPEDCTTLDVPDVEPFAKSIARSAPSVEEP